MSYKNRGRRTVEKHWAHLKPYERDAWIAEAILGWSVTKHLGWDKYGGREYWGNPHGKVNKSGGLAGIDIQPVRRYTLLHTEDYWIRALERGPVVAQEETP